MFIVRFQGGLGNQMFQYAFFHTLEHLFGDRVKVCADLTAYRFSNYHQGYELQKIFGIVLPKASDKDIYKLSGWKPWPYGRFAWRLLTRFNNCHYFSNLVAERASDRPYAVPTVIEARNIPRIDNYAESLFSKLSNVSDCYFDGYWQNATWFQPVCNEIPDIFSFQHLSSQDISFANTMQNEQSVAVHIRRDDYVGSGFDVLNVLYYKNAIQKILERVPDSVFYFFSDDLSYIYDTFKWLPSKHVISNNRGNQSFKDMFFISCCRHAVISNSTFSYWGAKLGLERRKEAGYPQSIIIAPGRLSKSIQRPLADEDWFLLDNTSGMPINL